MSVESNVQTKDLPVEVEGEGGEPSRAAAAEGEPQFSVSDLVDMAFYAIDFLVGGEEFAQKNSLKETEKLMLDKATSPFLERLAASDVEKYGTFVLIGAIGLVVIPHGLTAAKAAIEKKKGNKNASNTVSA